MIWILFSELFGNAERKAIINPPRDKINEHKVEMLTVLFISLIFLETFLLVIVTLSCFTEIDNHVGGVPTASVTGKGRH